jgi:hypothetical protein
MDGSKQQVSVSKVVHIQRQRIRCALITTKKKEEKKDKMKIAAAIQQRILCHACLGRKFAGAKNIKTANSG